MPTILEFRRCAVSDGDQKYWGQSQYGTVVVQFDKEASQARSYCGAKVAPQRAARPDPSLRKERLLRMTTKLHHYLWNRTESPKSR
jgi:hypothetical protein